MQFISVTWRKKTSVKKKILTNEETVENIIIAELEEKLDRKPWTTEVVAYILYKPQELSVPTGVKIIQDTLEMELPAANIQTHIKPLEGL